MKNKYSIIIAICLIILLSIFLFILLLPTNNHNIPQDTIPTDDHSHIWGEWTTETYATCTEKGSLIRYCECGEKDTMTLSKLEHSFSEWTITKEANCQNNGLKEHICSSCGFIETESIPSITHCGDKWVIIDYEKHFLCSYCNETYKVDQLKISVGLDINDKTLNSIGSCKDQEVVIPSTITIIGKQAFRYKTIVNVILSDSVNTIEDDSFYYCLNLNTVYLGNNVSVIGNRAFFNCSSLTKIELPSSLNILGEEAFAYCSNLNTVYITNSINRFEYGIFKHCTNLSNIYFDGTIQDWSNISKDRDWDFNTGEYVVHCNDGEIKKQ